ncbi:PEBP-like protein [Sistotremastrum niveocremeum HHB9708]|uniref:PEBP-like protein n=1 Tax=Sistotremastrum niveocremeum HHB9708 TaxID=1314777 RepID=A0A164QTL8_9AGAM|nr:PEBP-like protein [Sistotremastrum niveocremeum HHB9708]
MAVSASHGFGTPAQAREAFIRSKLVPDVFTKFNPILTLGITYHVNGTALKVHLGNDLTIPESANRPLWSIPDIKLAPRFSKKSFVIAMIDPDAPSPTNTTFAQIRHFIGGGFKLEGTTLRNTTPALSEYLSPGPPVGSPPHRYPTFLFLQPKNFPTTPFTTSIANFNVSVYAKQVDLGPPLAGNFMLVQA